MAQIPRLRRYRWALLALFAGMLLRLYFIHFHAHFVGDTLVYGDLAGNMLQHHVYGLTEGGEVRSTLIRLPGYPLFLAMCFAVFGAGKYAAVLYVQLVMDLVTCWLLGAVARRLWGSRAGLCGLWLAAVCPFTADYVSTPLTETPAIFFAAVALYSLERWSEPAGRSRRTWLWPLALSLTFAVMLRPDRALLAVAVISAMVWIAWRSSLRREKFVQIAVACAVVGLPLGLWGARNWRVFHVVQPLAPKYANDPGEFVSYGFQRWYRTWAVEFESTVKVYWEYDGDVLHSRDLPARAFDTEQQRAKTLAAIAAYNSLTYATPAIDAKFARLADERVAAHPVLYYVGLPVGRVADMWLRPRTEMLAAPLDWWRFAEHPRLSAWTAAYAALNLGCLLLAVLGVRRWWRAGGGPVGAAGLAYLLLRSAMLLTLDNSEPRYTIDCYPVVILFAALALCGAETQSDA